MQTFFRRFVNKIVKNLVSLDQEIPNIPHQLITILLIFKASIGLSYLQQKDEGYIYLLSIFGRPQLHVNTTIIQYIIFGIHLIYINAIFIQIPKRNFLALHGIMMRTNFLNICLETSKIPFCFITQPLTILISSMNQFVLFESLDVEVQNFKKVKVGYTDHVIFILSITISLLDFYEVSQYVVCFNILLHSLLSWINSGNIIEASIHSFVVIFTFFEIIGDKVQQSSFLIIFPLICKIHTRVNFEKKNQKQLIIKDKFKEQIISNSILIQRKFYLKSLITLSKLNSPNILVQAKKEKLQRKCIKLIYDNISGNYHKQSILVDCYQKILEIEEQSCEIIKELKDLMQHKLVLLQKNKVELFDHYYEFLESIFAFEQRILKINELNSSKKNKAIALFFFSEIANDFSQARNYFNYNKTSLQHDNYDFQKLSYIISKYNHEFTVTGVSRKSIFKDEPNFQLEQYIPSGIRQFHQRLVEQFIQNGSSKYFKQFDTSFIANERDNIMTSIDFGILVNATDELQFITFLQPSLEQTMTMILNASLHITCISELLAQSLNIPYYDIKHMGYSIKNFIPYYNETQPYQENLDVIILESDSETSYIASINQNIRIIDNQILYYVIHFESLRKSNNKIRSMTAFSQQQSFMEYTSICQDQKSKQDQETQLQFSIPEEDQVELPYGDFKDNNQCDFSDQIDISQDDNKISSPGNKEHSKQRLLRRTSFATKFRKQCSQILADDNNYSMESFKNTKHKKEDYLMEFYQQKLNIVNKFFAALFLTLLVTFIFFFFQTFQLNININDMVTDIDVLEFAQLCFQPLENNLLMVFAVSEYQLLYLMKQITIPQFQQLSLFPSQEIAQGYEVIYSNFNSLFSEKLLQSILDENSIIAYQYTNSSNIETYNMTLRKAFGILLEFQYDGLLDFKRNGKVNAETTHIYYIFKNYMTLKLIVINLNDQLLDQTIDQTEKNLQMVIILLVIGLVVITIFYLIIYVYFLAIVNQISRYYNILLQIPQHINELQIYNIKFLLHQVEQDNHFVFRYQYNEQKYGIENQNQNFKRTKSSNRLKYSGIKWKVGFFMLFSLILVLASVSFYLTKEYFKGYGVVAKFYKSISDVSIDVASMYSAREVLYFRTSFSYLQNDTIQQLLQIIDEGINRTQTFLMNSDQINNTIMSDTFKEQYQKVMQGDLCMQLSADLKNTTQLFCSQLFNGNMKNGLVAILTSIINNLRTEKSFSNFAKRTQSSKYDLEGPFLASNIISQLFKDMKLDLINNTTLLLNSMNVINGTLLCLLGLLILLSYFLFFKTLLRYLEISKKFATFVPLKFLLYDAGIERYIKNLIYKNNFC